MVQNSAENDFKVALKLKFMSKVVKMVQNDVENDLKVEV